MNMSQRLNKSALLDREGYSADQKSALKLWVVLARCYNSFAQSEAVRIKGYEITPPQFGVLEALAHLGPLKMCELAEKLLMSGANVTGVIDRLEEKGFVQRVMEADDRRTYRIHLTGAGGKLIADIFPAHAEKIRRLTHALSAKEKRVLAELLKKLGKSLQQDLQQQTV
jgi:MarR family 2-MHQ and catechol resistance regulon transcriptional repressor